MNGLPLFLLASTVSMDFGWQPAVDNPNMLEYIIQLSPEEVQLLNSGKEELFSGIPQELKGRIDRVVIRMGREKLPQEPSLEKLRTMAAVGGNPSILNAGGSAGGTNLSAPPSLASTTPLSPQGGLTTIDPPRTLPSFSSNINTTPVVPIAFGGNYDLLASGVYEDLLRQGTMPPPTQPYNANPPPINPPDSLAGNNGIPAIPVVQSGTTNPPSILPADPRLAPPATTPNNPPNAPIFPKLNGGNTTLPAGGWASTSGNIQNPPANGGNPPRTPQSGAAVGFNNNSLAGNTLGNNPSILPSGSNGNFVNAPATTSTNGAGFNAPPTQYLPSGGNNFANNPGNGYAGVDNSILPNRIQPGNNNGQFGTSPTLIASSNPGSGSAGITPAMEDEDVSPSETNDLNDEKAALASASNWEKVLQILFILSIVLNFYLGVHLHKLLLRYRNLLSSVRASTTVA